VLAYFVMKAQGEQTHDDSGVISWPNMDQPNPQAEGDMKCGACWASMRKSVR
jgi:hypothetical protein